MGCLPIGSVLSVLLAASLAATPMPAEDDPWKSETFLADYSGLQPVASKTALDYVYVAPQAEEKLARCDAIMVDQPEISISPASPYNSAKPDELKAISEFMRTTIVERLQSRGLRIVDHEGENVLYLRVALTHLQLKKKRRGVLSYTPVGAVVHGVKSAVQEVMNEVDIIDMAGQAEVAASHTGEVLGAMVTRPRGAAGTTGGGKPERMTFEEFKAHVDEYSDRLACRVDNGRKPADRRVDCTDPAAATPPGGEAPGK